MEAEHPQVVGGINASDTNDKDTFSKAKEENKNSTVTSTLGVALGNAVVDNNVTSCTKNSCRAPKVAEIDTVQTTHKAKKKGVAVKPSCEETKELSEKKIVQQETAQTITSTTMVQTEYQQVVQGLDQAYGAVTDDHACDDDARRIFARRAALASLLVTCSFLCSGALFFASQTKWSVVDVALFTVYTVTSAGYGHVDIPQSALFRIFDTFYILIGLSLMAIMMAQVYQYFELEATRLHHDAADKAQVLQQGIDRLKREKPSPSRDRALAKMRSQRRNAMGLFGKPALFLSRLIVFSIDNPWGDFLYRITSLIGMAMLGAVVVGCLEGWNWYTSMYWSVVSLTTVGYGDVVPSTDAGKVFTTVWLPLNLFFLSILFCSVGHYYLHFSDQQIKKIKEDLHRKRQDERAKKSASSGTPSTDTETPDLEAGGSNDHDGISSSGENAKLPRSRRFFGKHLDTMQDVLEVMNGKDPTFTPGDSEVGDNNDPGAILVDAPNFYLRVKVKERVAYIVAKEVAGRQSHVTTEDMPGMLSVFLGGTVKAAQKWAIPRHAVRAFRAVAFEALLFVGESALVELGPAALFRLSPDEFHRIFSPLLVAIGDAETLESWLTSTDTLWETEMKHRRKTQLSQRSLHSGHKDFAKSGEKVEFPTNHAEGFHLFRGT